jgi:hypothetical protein
VGGQTVWSSTVLVLYFTGTVLSCYWPNWAGTELDWYCDGSVLVLCWCCVGAVLALGWYYSWADTVQILCWYCTGTELILYWYWC